MSTTLTAILAGSLAGPWAGGVAPATAAIDEPDRWQAVRVLKNKGVAAPSRVYSGRNGWALALRPYPSISGDPDSFAVRERVPGDGWGRPRYHPYRLGPGTGVDTSPDGDTWISYVGDGDAVGRGRLKVARHSAGGQQLRPATDLGRLGISEGSSSVVAGTSGRVLVATATTWHERLRDGTWTTYPAPTPVPGGSDLRLFYTQHGDLLAFADRDGDLFVSRRVGGPSGGWSAPSVVAPAGSAQYVHTKEGGRLVTRDRGAGEAIRLFSYERHDSGGFAFVHPRVLASGSVAGEQQAAPHVLVDDFRTLTVAWQEPRATRPGVRVVQEPRRFAPPLAELIPGSRTPLTWDLTVAPRGTLTFAFSDADRPQAVTVRHLPAGTASWTDPVKLTSSAPRAEGDGGSSLQLGSPTDDGDVTGVMDDARGLIGWTFNAPDPVTTIIQPSRSVTDSKRYTVAWRTKWSLTDRSQLRYRTVRAGGTSAWRQVRRVALTATSVSVIHPRGEKRCYQARGRHSDVGIFTPWSAQRCVTVGR